MSYLVQAASGSFRVLGEVSGELSPASVYVSLLPVGEACVVAACAGVLVKAWLRAD